jgi:hypothetical protein
MEPVGITNASAMNALKSNARTKATAKLSTVSRTTCKLVEFEDVVELASDMMALGMVFGQKSILGRNRLFAENRESPRTGEEQYSSANVFAAALDLFPNSKT